MNPETRNNLFWPIVVGVVVALIAGGSAPWWWQHVLNNKAVSAPACVVDKVFKANIYFDKRKDMKGRLKAELEVANYYGDSTNTDFNEFENPGKPGTIWVVHPLCIKEDDQRLLKVIGMLRSKGYAKGSNLFLFANKSPEFTKAIQISIF